MAIPGFLWLVGDARVVSLAAALSIPVYMDNGQLFPERSLILFVTFSHPINSCCSGINSPLLIKKLNLPSEENEMSEEQISASIFKEMTAETVHYLQDKYGDKIQDYPHVMNMVAKWEKKYNDVENVCRTAPSKNLYIDLLEFQRRWLLKKNAEYKDLDEDIIKNI
jgi:CPA1 family monovalent cation:H+ antiporter